MWEGGPRVPTAISWPDKIKAGRTYEHMASTIDILPTLAEISGSGIPEKKIDGISLYPLLQGENVTSIRNEFYYYYYGSLIAVRRGEWKLVFPHKYRSYEGMEPGNDGFPGPLARGSVDQHELYNLINDNGERNDVSKEHPEIVEELKELGKQARQQLGDRITNTRGTEIRKAGRIDVQSKKIDHLGMGKKIKVNQDYAFQYYASGDQTLLDGELGSLDFKDDKWLGFEGSDVEVLIDLGEMTTVNSVESRFLVKQGSWIFAPIYGEILVSSDGETFTLLERFENESSSKDDQSKISRYITSAEKQELRYIKLRAKNTGICPEWHPGAGDKAWLFFG